MDGPRLGTPSNLCLHIVHVLTITDPTTGQDVTDCKFCQGCGVDDSRFAALLEPHINDIGVRQNFSHEVGASFSGKMAESINGECPDSRHQPFKVDIFVGLRQGTFSMGT
jgi:hypothetical protein